MELIGATVSTPVAPNNAVTLTVLLAAMDPQQAIAMYVDIVLLLLDDSRLQVESLTN